MIILLDGMNFLLCSSLSSFRQYCLEYFYAVVFILIFGASLVAQSVKNMPALQEIWV